MAILQNSVIPVTAADAAAAEFSVDNSCRFDGSTSYLNRTFGAGNQQTWTLSAWVKLGNLAQAGERGVILTGTNGGPTIYDDSGLRFAHAYDPSGDDYIRETKALIRDPSAWYHVCWWCDLTVTGSTATTGTRWKIYINGVLQELETPSGGGTGEPPFIDDWQHNSASHVMAFNNAAVHKLGGGFAGVYFDGYLADVHFIDGTAIAPLDNFVETNSDGQLVPKEFSMAPYLGNSFHIPFTGGHDSELLINSNHREGSTNFEDSSGAGHYAIDDTGDPEHSIRVGNPFTGDDRAIHFDGNGDYLTVGTTPSVWEPGTGEFCYEMWYRSDGLLPASPTVQYLFMTPLDSNSTKYINFRVHTDGTVKSVIGWAGGNNGDQLANVNVHDGKWHHLALSRDNTSDTINLYVDGKNESTYPFSGTPDISGFASSGYGNFTIGASYEFDSTTMTTGYIDDFRMVLGSKVYKAFTDLSSSEHAITPIADVKHTGRGPTATSRGSVQFDGTGDMLNIDYDEDFGWKGGNTGHIQIEAWVYANVLHGNDTILALAGDNANWTYWPSPQSDGNATGIQWYLQSESSGTQLSFTYRDTSDNNAIYLNAASSTSGFGVGAWHHIAFSMDGTTASLYIDGTRRASSTSITSSFAGGTPKLRVGMFPTVTASSWNGWIDDVRIKRGAGVTYTGASITVPTAPLTADDDTVFHLQSLGRSFDRPTSKLTEITNTKLLIQADVNDDPLRILDSSSKKHGITLNGDVTHSIAQKKVGTNSSIKFDGTGDYLTVPDHADFTWDGDFTLEMWVNFSDVGVANNVISHSADSAGFFIVYWSNSTGWNWGGTSATNSNVFGNAAAGVAADTWYHVAFVRASGVTNCYQDGVKVGSDWANTYTIDAPTSGTLQIGVDHSRSAPLTGYLDEIRISNTARYTEDFDDTSVITSPSAYEDDANTLLLIHSDSRCAWTDEQGDANTSQSFTDSSGSEHDIAAYGDATHSTAQKKIGASSIYLDGTSDWLATGYSADFAFGTGAYTYEAWVRPATSQVNSAHAGVLGAYQSSTATPEWGSFLQINAGNWHVYAPTSSEGDGDHVDTGVAATANTWQHMVLVYDGADLSAYKDGVRIYNDTVSLDTDQASYKVHIGSLDGSGSYEYTGHIDEIRITKGHAVYSGTDTSSANFALPTALTDTGGTYSSATNISNPTAAQTKLLIHSDGIKHTITGAGDLLSPAPTASTPYDAAMKRSAIHFDGDGDYLSLADSTDWEFDGEFTVECWANFSSWQTNTGSVQTIMGTARQNGYTTGADGGWVLSYYSGQEKIYFAHFGPGPPGDTTRLLMDIDKTLALDTWYHFAVTRDSSNIVRVYLDGVVIGTSSAHSDTFPDGQGFRIGDGNTQTDNEETLIGYLDEIRISNTARYTEDFDDTSVITSPSAYEDDANTLLLIHSDSRCAWTDESTTGTTHTITGAGDLLSPAPTASTPYEVAMKRSAINFDGSGDYLEVPASTDFDFGTGDFTLECWVWPKSGEGHWFINRNVGVGSAHTSRSFAARINSDGTVTYFGVYSSPHVDEVSTETVTFDDWNHIAIVRSSNVTKVYVNGVGSSGATDNDDHPYATTHKVQIGAGQGSTGDQAVEGYLYDICITKGVAKYTSAFDKPTNPFVTTKLTHPGGDDSGNKNHFDVENIGGHDIVADSPGAGKNFCTFNPLQFGTADSGSATLSEGNLKAVTADGTVGHYQPTTIYLTSGKWYAEFRVSATGQIVGIVPSTASFGTDYLASGIGLGVGMYCVTTTARLANYNNLGDWTDMTGKDFASGDIIGIALDLDDTDGEVTAYTVGGDFDSGQKLNTGFALKTAASEWAFCVGNDAGVGWTTEANFGQDPTFCGTESPSTTYADEGGVGSFMHEPPSGFLALCTANLPTPGLNNAAADEKAFSIKLYSGSGAQTGLGFQPDLTWIKDRDATYSHVLVDSVRGADGDMYALSSNGTSGEIAEKVESLDSDGFTVDSSNGVGGGNKYVAWNWKAGTAFSGTDYSGSSNGGAGFSIVKWLGNDDPFTDPGADRGVPHNLTATPELIIAKDRDTSSSWPVWHKSLNSGAGQYLDESYPETTSSPEWGQTAPGGTNFTVADGTSQSGYSLNSSGTNYIAYCFQSIPDYSKIGNYLGNESTDGTFLYCGFRPAFVMIKAYANVSSSQDEPWMIYDSARSGYNPTDLQLYANLGIGEGSTHMIDFLSNGIKIRNDARYTNLSGASYLFYAVAENPFKHANAR